LPTGSKAKVSNTGIIGDVDENIIGFQVSMNNAMTVNVAQAIENLSEQTPGAVYVVVQAVFNQITQCLYS
jgi:hypothetical protein